MMGTLLAYSGLVTKIKAMSSRLITDEEFQQIASFSSVQEVAQYLKNHPAYQKHFAGFDDASLHRGEMEYLIRYSVYSDYFKLYRFASQKQRKFIKEYFSRYEVQILKTCLRKIFDPGAAALKLGIYYPFFEKHSDIKLSKAEHASTIEELAESVQGTIYESAFQLTGQSLTLFDYETALDLLHFTKTWKQITKQKGGTELQVMTETFGSQIDLLNIQWIYRSKRYYRLTSADIYAMIIPVRYKLKKSTIAAMVEAASAQEVLKLLQTTYYAKHFKELDQTSIELLYRDMVKELYDYAVRKYPYSIACVNTYLYKKELEVKKLTSVLEGIRYSLPMKEILNIVL